MAKKSAKPKSAKVSEASVDEALADLASEKKVAAAEFSCSRRVRSLTDPGFGYYVEPVDDFESLEGKRVSINGMVRNVEKVYLEDDMMVLFVPEKTDAV